MPEFYAITTVKVGKLLRLRPEFKIGKPADLMIRGGSFYAFWNPIQEIWDTDETHLFDILDAEIDAAKPKYPDAVPQYFKNASDKLIDDWIHYTTKQMRDTFVPLDSSLMFKSDKIKLEDHATKRLNYDITEGTPVKWNKLLHTLYDENEAHKIEWCIGAILSGDSKKMQKFLVFYGEAGSGKSTIIGIIEQLFEGYTAPFNAASLGKGDTFALEDFRNNPLVAIQHDGDLSKIEDNTKLNSLISHERMSVNEKFKSVYSTSFDSFLIMGTNSPVKITDSKSGLLRRLIDVHPSGRKLPSQEYERLMNQIPLELGQIAYQCLNVYKENPRYYNSYVPLGMMATTNDFYNFMLDQYVTFKSQGTVTLTQAWKLYKLFVEDGNIPYPLKKTKFKEELKPYFEKFIRKGVGGALDDTYIGIKDNKFQDDEPEANIVATVDAPMVFTDTESEFDKMAQTYPAQVARAEGTPMYAWDNCFTQLKDIDTHLLHYVRVPENHIVIDFDIPDPKTGEKSFELNAKAAAEWPETYSELSKSGAGIHLHYIYDGDPRELSSIFDEHIEIKVYTGKSSLRRKLSKCINRPIAHISSGLPMKEENKKMINKDVVTTEKGLRKTIIRCLRKEIHPNTRCNIDWIYKILDDAYNAGVVYDVTDLQPDVFAFAAQSSHQADYCLKLVQKMKFKSETTNDNIEGNDQPIVFFDIEVFPNLLLVNWKYEGPDAKMVRMINPSAEEVEQLITNNRLVGFNNRRYDNHILYARTLGYTNEEMYNLSYKIVNSKKGELGCMFREAYNISYTDIYDFAAKKQSLKKWEIELGLHHQELGMPWDQPVPEDRWAEVAEYCDNDVISTEAVWNHLQPDWNARQILASVAGLTVNDTTNTLTTKIILQGDTKTAKQQFNWRDMSDESDVLPWAEEIGEPKWTNFNTKGQPIFKGYKFYNGKSTYRGEEVGEGGYVFATTGIWHDVALLDIASMHPASIIAEDLFGPYTQRFKDIRDARVAIKHADWESARTMLGGALAPYVADEEIAAAQADNLSQALKIAINSVYGLTAASFDHPMHDPRNIDNIVAKRGALFMINLKNEVQKRGFTVAHIKTDSIKIPNATPEIIKFVTDYGKMYGYTFEHEATYEKMCLVNDAVYIAKYASVDRCCELYGRDYVESAGEVCKKNKKKGGHWEATGTQFQIPYVYKTLFTHEPIDIADLAQTKEVKTSIYLKYKEDDLRFIGKVGSFCPVVTGGAELVRENKAKDGTIKYDSVTGTKGYKWMETEELIAGHMEDLIDKSFYKSMADAAIDTIKQYGDYEAFID